MRKIKKIYCLGDSHVGFFSGQNTNRKIRPIWPNKIQDKLSLFKTFHLGPILAYSLMEEKTTSRGREKLFECLKTIPKNSTIILCFGEIDCRCHILKQVQIQNKNTDKIIQNCIERYLFVIKEIQKLNFNIFIWNLIPPSPFELQEDRQFPSYGNLKERKEVLLKFNKHLERELKQISIPFISIYKKLTNNEGTLSKKYLLDKIHLNIRAIPFAIKEIKRESQIIFFIKIKTYFEIVKNKLYFTFWRFFYNLKAQLKKLLKFV